jgi:hypothetical protein
MRSLFRGFDGRADAAGRHGFDRGGFDVLCLDSVLAGFALEMIVFRDEIA